MKSEYLYIDLFSFAGVYFSPIINCGVPSNVTKQFRQKSQQHLWSLFNFFNENKDYKI